jgi:hypothetical protein
LNSGQWIVLVTGFLSVRAQNVSYLGRFGRICSTFSTLWIRVGSLAEGFKAIACPLPCDLLNASLKTESALIAPSGKACGRSEHLLKTTPALFAVLLKK